MSVAPSARAWTIEDLERMPDDGNTYEVVRGELFVTPAPTPLHQRIIARLNALLVPYVAAHGLGMVHTARAVVRRRGSEVEPDLFVGWIADTWESSPIPVLVVEVLSDSTRRRDLNQKRAYYMDDVEVPEYWVVDPEARSVRVVRQAQADQVVTGTLSWHPAGAATPLSIAVQALFA